MNEILTTDASSKMHVPSCFSMSKNGFHWPFQFIFFHFSSKLTTHNSKIRDIKRHYTQRWTGTQKICPCDNFGVMQLQVKETDNHQKLGEKHKQILSPYLQGRTNPSNTLILGFWPPKLYKNKFLNFLPTKFWALCYSSSRKWIQWLLTTFSPTPLPAYHFYNESLQDEDWPVGLAHPCTLNLNDFQASFWVE